MILPADPECSELYCHNLVGKGHYKYGPLFYVSPRDGEWHCGHPDGSNIQSHMAGKGVAILVCKPCLEAFNRGREGFLFPSIPYEDSLDLGTINVREVLYG